MKVVLYSTHCPRCEVLEEKLKKANIEYEEINDVDTMLAKGYTTTPMLEVEGKSMEFKEANSWINSLL